LRESPSSQPRSSWPSSWLEAAGAALLLAPGLIWNQLSSTHLDLYHRLLPITAVVRALALDVAVLSLLAVLALRALERIAGRNASPSPYRRNSWILVWALWLGLLVSRLITGLIVAQLLSWQELSAGRAFAVTAGILLLIWIFAPQRYLIVVRGLRAIVLLFGFCIFWALPMLVMAGFAHQPRDHAEFQKPIPPAAAPHPRIVWLLFDELSYDQLFDHRWPGLNLPNFDRLHAQSVTFSAMEPDGYFTERIIPSLFLGKPIVDARSTEAGALRYQSAKGAPWQTFDENATLFADARRQGWTTGISGDYNPYCRMLPDQLDSCVMRLSVFGEHLSRDKSTWSNFAAPGHAIAARALHQPYEPAPGEDRIFANMMDSVRQLLANDTINLAFVHLFLPHPPGLYDRKTGRVLLGGSYIDNLALADRTLGDLLASLAQTPSVNQTTLIVSSDHGWRVGIWRHGFGWTREDELASQHGHFDPRPTLIVRFPGESSPAGISRPVPLLAMHDMIERMIAGEIGSPQQLTTWAAQQ
jgi:Sulfatase